jgi:hypothetical protein
MALLYMRISTVKKVFKKTKRKARKQGDPDIWSIVFFGQLL